MKRDIRVTFTSEQLAALAQLAKLADFAKCRQLIEDDEQAFRLYTAFLVIARRAKKAEEKRSAPCPK